MSLAPPEPAVGLRPPAYEHSIHLQRCLAQLRSKDSPLEKYIYLSQLKDADPRAFYRLAVDHMSEVTPLIYTPTVGEACQKWSHIYRRPDGMYISLKDKGKIGAVLRNWPRQEEARISVVTDGSRILGLGDLGVNGMGISVGKLSLYIAGAGIRPESTIPICLDLGTNNKKNLDDPFYLGLRQPRASSEEYHDFMEEFMSEMKNTFPKLLVQFEDFTTDHAFEYLGAFRDRYPVFNDDIQGTGAVVLSGFVNAAKQASLASGRPLSDHRILFFGAGSAGVGVAMQLLSFFTISGLSEAEARERVWFVDTQGLIYDARGKLAEHKKYFARKDYAGPPITNLLDIINYVKPTALIGLSTISGAFYKEAIELMAALNPRPIIFPLSNPVTLSECSFHDALTWTNGKVIFASGSPFPAEEYQGVTHTPGQGNNMYIFPALGLGAILSRAKHVTDSMVEASSLALADSLTEEEKKEGLLYPRLERIREIGVKIASQVIRTAQSEGVDTTESLRTMKDDELAAYVKSRMWNP
ncbi:malic enzyme [Sistotremastrum suecicum HHB10207 ss-3]|uniref:Malic enzyme n=1 Tax=Sistotremastrum suecicum HHB10207 ss-3 TaxID=1314776 RepID=A0A166BA20_9AGAM|nr:malic enzyme [Sistotremastrum suecicum HHB10207 ss-3]